MTEICPSCHGVLPGGCSTCRPMSPPRVGRITLEPGVTGHTCPRCMRGLPCDPSSLSAIVGQIASRQRTDSEWKRDVFPQETQ